MNKNKTHIVLVIDRSGSMAYIKTDAEGGINSLINAQKTAPGEASLTIYDFDNTVEKPVDLSDIKGFQHYVLSPRGGTALYDAVCKAIDETGAKLSALKEEDRPGLVLVAVVTDGQENSSKTFSLENMKSRISVQQNIYNWQFTFLCADPTALQEAIDIGVRSAESYSLQKTAKAYEATSGKFTRMRGMSSAGESVDNSYTESEIKSMI